MNRRGFLARVAAFVPVTAVLSHTRFKSIVRVTVNHDDATPVEFTVIGQIATSGAALVEYTAAAPFRAKTPLAFSSFPGAKPTIIQAASGKVRVVADSVETGQHLIAKAPRVTIRMHRTPPQMTVTNPLIEIVGEPASNR